MNKILLAFIAVTLLTLSLSCISCDSKSDNYEPTIFDKMDMIPNRRNLTLKEVVLEIEKMDEKIYKITRPSDLMVESAMWDAFKSMGYSNEEIQEYILDKRRVALQELRRNIIELEQELIVFNRWRNNEKITLDVAEEVIKGETN